MRIDDLVRTERYFTALLIHVLLSENLSGVDAFIDLLCERGILTDRPPGNASDDPRSQVVAELAATRDLLKGGYEFDDPESPPRDVVDVVIVALGILIAVEAKFFSPTSLSKVKGQLKTQGAALEQFHTDPSFSVSRVCQVFLTADEGIRPDHVDGTPVLYWRDVAELAIKCKQTYVADRLERALQRYKVEFGGAAGPAEWKLVQGLDAVVAECRQYGRGIEVGYIHRLDALRATPLSTLLARVQPWKVRYVEGVRTSDRWILGNEFARVIDEMRGRLAAAANPYFQH